MGRPLPSINVILLASFNEELISGIMKKGARLGAHYFNGPDRIPLSDYGKAAKIGMYPDHDSEDMQFLILELKGMGLYLFFNKTKEDYLLMSFSPGWGFWEKPDPNSGFIDISRYVRLLLDMVDDFHILGLRVVDEGHEDIFDDVLY